MRVLVACEMSGRVRDAFIRRGHDAVSYDLLPTLAPGPHVQGDVLAVLTDGWDLMVAFPPCTYLSNVGACWWPQRQPEQAAALEFAARLWNAPIPRIAVENPLGRISRVTGPATQWVHPWMFGDPYMKRTGLWLKSLPLLTPTHEEPVHLVPWTSQTGAPARGHERSLTFQGIAEAMARTWGQ